MRPPGAVVLLLACVACGGACGGDGRSEAAETPAQTKRWPAGTWLAVDDVALPAAEVQRVADVIGLIYPAHSESSRRRDALATFLLPRAALHSAYGNARAEALVLAEAALETLRNQGVAPGGDAPGPVAPPVELAGSDHGVERHRGGWDDLDLQTWGFARVQQPGRWFLFERIGGFQLIRVEERVPGDRPGLDVLEISIAEFPYLPADFSSEEQWEAVMTGARLEVVDPAAGDDVPERFRYMMRGGESR